LDGTDERLRKVRRMGMIPALGLVALALAGVGATSQVQETEKAGRTGAKAEAVQYLYPEQVTVPAGKASAVALHFRIRQGLHINSHAPKDEYLIPTVFSIPESSGVKLESAEYPAGTEFELPVEPGTKLIVYTGEFAIQTRLTALPGDHMVEAKLRYQACDANACLPPKTITVPIDVVGK
jgi:DsbC/DsbD-like thiol-disulfide interchange protein